MKRLLLILVLLAVAGFLSAQEVESSSVDLTGPWDAYRLTSLARYTLRDYQAGQAVIQPDELTLESDGTATSTIPNLGVQTWRAEGGFLILETTSGNVLYYPRVLSEDVVFLVQLDVLKLNEDIVSIKTGSFGHMVVVRQ